MNAYQRLFGSGPHGLGLGYVILLATAKFVPRPDWPPIITVDLIRTIATAGLMLAGVAVILWSVVSLPPENRGRKLTTSGAFRFFRHPLYAGLVTFFNFGLALFLNHWMFVIWALAVHPLMHWAIRYEEGLMRDAFPDEYEAYCNRTGRFVPRPGAFRAV